MPPIVIGLLGKKGSGKTTAAHCLAREYNITELTFAEPLKQIARVFGFTDAECNGTQQQKEQPNELWGVSFRQFATICGTELFRQQLPTHLPQMTDCWVRLLEQRICRAKQLDNIDVIVVSDVRFQNEADSIRRAGGILIRIEKDSPELNTGHTTDTHSSETEQDGIVVQYAIQNNGTVCDLQKEICRIVEQHITRDPYSFRRAFATIAVIVVAWLAAWCAAYVFKPSTVVNGGHFDYYV